MVATRFAVAAHIMVLLAVPGRGPAQATSGRLAMVVGTNPVVVRRITGQLARAGLIRVHRGPGGAELVRQAGTITLQDVWHAVHAGRSRPLVPLHESGEGVVPALLGSAFATAETAFIDALGDMTIAALAARLETH